MTRARNKEYPEISKHIRELCDSDHTTPLRPRIANEPYKITHSQTKQCTTIDENFMMKLQMK
jgi:hypothetical protein